MAQVDWPLLSAYKMIYSQTTSAHLIDAANEKCAFLLYAPKTGNIRSVTIRLGTVTTSQSLTVSLQDRDPATGYPDGTQDQSGTIASPASNTTYTVTMGSDRAVTKGDLFAVVVEFTSTVGNLNVLSTGVGVDISIVNTAEYVGAPAWSNGNRIPIVGILYDDGTAGQILGCAPGVPGNSGWNNASGNITRGLRFTVPTPVYCHGFYAQVNTTADVEFGLYQDNSATPVATVQTIDKDLWFSSSVQNVFVPFVAATLLSPGITYRATFKPTSATNTDLIYTTVASTALLAQMGSTEWYWTQGTPGSWSDTNTQRPHVVPILQGVDQGGMIAPVRILGAEGVLIGA